MGEKKLLSLLSVSLIVFAIFQCAFLTGAARPGPRRVGASINEVCVVTCIGAILSLRVHALTGQITGTPLR